jgi:starch-binding outer membrane protein, SusD/RagB family
MLKCKIYIYIISTIFFLLLSVSCTDLFVENPTQFRNDKTLNSSALMPGLYASLKDWRYYKSGFVINLQVNAIGYTNSTVGGSNLSKLLQSPTSTEVGWIYSTIYSSIAQANTVLSLLDEKSTDVEIMNNRGQAIFIRTLDYFNLFRIYGRVPIITKVSDSEVVAVPRPKSDSVMYEFLIAQANQAYNLLKDQQSLVYIPKKQAAMALLATIYLQRASQTGNRVYWQQAETVAQSVIDSKVYTLLGNYVDLFSISNKFNTESIFEIPFSNQAGQGQSFTSQMAPWYSNKWCSADQSKGLWPQGQVQVNRETVDDIIAVYGKTTEARTKFNLTIDPILGYDGTKKDYSHLFCFYPTMQKDPMPKGSSREASTCIQTYKDPTAPALDRNQNDFYVLRLAEMYLIVAEAENELNGPTQLGIDNLNAIIQRGNGMTVSLGNFADQASLRSRIMTERKIEFMAENKLWFDERRRGVDYFKNVCDVHNTRYAKMVADMNSGNDWVNYDYFSTVPASVDDAKRNLLWPIPASEINANDSISISDQNFGY